MKQQCRKFCNTPLLGLKLMAIVSTVALVASLSSCNNTGCADRRSALPLAGLYNAANEEPIVLDSIAVGGVDAPGGDLLVAPGEATRSIYLPLRMEQKSTSFYIHYAYPAQGLDDDALNDTISIDYEAQPYFASEECGAFYVYHISAVEHTSHIISHVELTDSVVDNIDVERLRIYFRVAEADDQEQPESAPRALSQKGGERL